MIYLVVRPHIGDRAYQSGDRREADPGDVAHLVPKVLVPMPDDEGAGEPVPAPVKARARRGRA